MANKISVYIRNFVQLLMFQLILKLEFNGQVSLMVILSVPDSNSPENGSNGWAGAGTGAFGTFMGTNHFKKSGSKIHLLKTGDYDDPKLTPSFIRLWCGWIDRRWYWGRIRDRNWRWDGCGSWFWSTLERSDINWSHSFKPTTIFYLIEISPMTHHR